jgi:hypothetical protein
MNHFNQLPEFEKEFSKLSKKYPSLAEDLKKFEKLVEIKPTGVGKNFTIIHCSEKVKIVKTRLACKSLKCRSIRVIYAHHNDTATFAYIELYCKGDKENENRERIKDYLKNNF